MAEEDLTARLKATGQGAFRRALRGAGDDTARVGDRARRSAGGLRLFAAATTSTTRGLRLMSGAAVTGGAAAAVGMGLFAKSAIDAASDVNESTTKNQTLFGRYAGTVSKFAETSASSMGISRRAAMESTGTFGNLFTALRIGPKRSADMSVGLTKLAGDLASFNNASPEEALEAIRSGLVGETEPLRRFGVNLSDAALRTEALNQGLVKNTKSVLTPQQKALAVNALLYKQTTKAQGDFHRTSGGLANQQRILKARWDDVTVSVGQAFLPAALSVVTAINRQVMPALDHFGSALGKIWGEGSDAGSFQDKMKATGASARHWLLDPLEAKARTFWADNREAIISGAESAVAAAGSRMADAAAAAAPHAAGAFVRAFKGAGVWGQLLTVALVSKKLGVFGTLGRMGCNRFGGSWSRCAPGKVAGGIEAASKGGRFATAARGLGASVARLAWPVALAALTVAMVEHFASDEPGKAAESGNPEGVRPHHRVRPGEGPTGTEIDDRRRPDPGPSTGPGGIGAPPVGATIPRKGASPFARKGAAPRATAGAALFHGEFPLTVNGRELGRATARIAAGDLAGA